VNVPHGTLPEVNEIIGVLTDENQRAVVMLLEQATMFFLQEQGGDCRIPVKRLDTNIKEGVKLTVQSGEDEAGPFLQFRIQQ